MLALGVAPAIVRAASLMPVVTPAGLLVPAAWPKGYVALPELLEIQRQANEMARQTCGGDYVLFCHPSWVTALRELMLTGSARVIYQQELPRYG